MKLFKVAAINSSDIFELRKNEEGKMEGVAGIDYELLQILSRILDFNFEIIYPEDGGWGSQMSNGRYTGMMGILQRQEADMSMVNIFLSLERLQIVDFSFPYSNDQKVFALRKPELKRDDLAYFHCFDNWVWLAFITSILLCSIIFAIMMIKYQKKKKINIWTRFLTALEIITGMKEYETMGRSLEVRTFIGSKLMVFLFLTLIYSSVFLSFLSAPLKEPPITTYNQLLRASQDGKVKACLMDTRPEKMMFFAAGRSHWEEWVVELTKHEKDPVFHQSPIVRMMNNFAIIEAKTFLKLLVARAGLSHIIDVPTGDEKLSFVGIAFKKSFRCVMQFDEAVMRLIETGISEKMMGDYLFKLQVKAPKPKLEIKSNQIKLSDVSSVLYIVGPCYLFSLVVLLLENFWQKCMATNH